MGMSKLLDDLDDLMMPYRCSLTKCPLARDWGEIINWLDSTCGEKKWHVERNEIYFAREKHVVWFVLRWL